MTEQIHSAERQVNINIFKRRKVIVVMGYSKFDILNFISVLGFRISCARSTYRAQLYPRRGLVGLGGTYLRNVGRRKSIPRR